MENNLDRPVPKPRNKLMSDTIQNSYENVSIDVIDKNIIVRTENLQNNTKDKIQNDKSFPIDTADNATGRKNVITEINKLTDNKQTKNVNQNGNDKSLTSDELQPPVPAPRKSNTTNTNGDNYQNYYLPTNKSNNQEVSNSSETSDSSSLERQRATGAIRKNNQSSVVIRKAPGVPEIPIKTKKKSLSRTTSEVEEVEGEPKLSVANSNLKKTVSSTTISSTDSSEDGRKFKTTSPGEIFKSLGATSKLLGESIGERVVRKSKNAFDSLDKNLKTSKEKFSETTKNVREKISSINMVNNLTMGKKGKKVDKNLADECLDRPQTLPMEDEVFNKISFSSPLEKKSYGVNNLNDENCTYEVPKSNRTTISEKSLPSYDDIVGSKNGSNSSLSAQSCPPNSPHPFTRNSPFSQSMGSHLNNGKRTPEDDPTVMVRNKSLSNLNNSRPESFNLPCPTFPPPVLNKDELYGKIRNINTINEGTELSSHSLRNKNNLYENTSIRPRSNKSTEQISSTRATIDSMEFEYPIKINRNEKVFSRDASHNSRSDSWSFYDVNESREDDEDEVSTSSSEPIYANENAGEMENSIDGLYGKLSKTTNSKKGACLGGSSKENAKLNSDLINEFDPLVMKTFDEIFGNKSNELILLENFLSEETYSPVHDDLEFGEQIDSSDDDEEPTPRPPVPPHRSESLINESVNKNLVTPTPQAPTKPVPPKPSACQETRNTIIIHQNSNLRSDSMENIVDECEAVSANASRSNNSRSNNNRSADNNEPSNSKSNWFLNDNETTRHSNEMNLDNSFEKKPIEKVIKTVPKLNNIDKTQPPSYDEAIGLMDANSNKTAIMNTSGNSNGSPTAQPKIGKKSMFSNVLTRMEGINLNLKRKASFKSGNQKSDVKVIIEMIPKATMSDKYLTHEGHLIRLPSGVVEDILKELQSRKVILRDRRFQTFLDKEQKTPKENFSLEHITTIQSVEKHKFSNQMMELYCFEVTTASPKNGSISHTMSNPNMVMTSANNGNRRTQRICHLYGVGKESERNIWMQKLIESMTDVFPSAFTCKYYRAGWCYLKSSISGQWSGTWVLLQKRKRQLIFRTNSEMNVEYMDLRKARCIVLKESDESINNLHVESGPMLMIDCPPHTVYLIMCSQRETKIWRHIIKEVAHNNGSSLKEQQLTKDEVPVLVDKCINFIYAHGSMTVGIYRKSGSEGAINKLLHMFRTDAFNVQIIRSEYNEHDVANVLKRFMRDLPERLLSKYAVSFISVSEMKSKTEKIRAYKELIHRLPPVEFYTLKKINGHLNFIQSQHSRNKMDVSNLALIWGTVLLQDKDNENYDYSVSLGKESKVVAELITYYKNLYQLSHEEIAREQMMLSVLQKYHAAAENLSDSVKKSGDIKVWITVNKHPENETEEKTQVNCTLNPLKTVYDICKELANVMNCSPYSITLNEIILNGNLTRPLHHSERVFDVVLKWSYWPEADRKNNYLEVRPIDMLRKVDRALKNLPVVSMSKELKFADAKTKTMKTYTLELIDRKLTVLKKEKNQIVNVREIDLTKIIAYIGCEKKRDFHLRWAITLFDIEANKNVMRTRESPYFGHVIAGSDTNDQITWYSGLFHALYGDEVLPPPEIIIQ